MSYSTDQVQEFNEFRASLIRKNQDLLLKLATLNSNLQVEEAGEFLMKGAGRRLKTITRCLENILNLFPVEREDRMSEDELSDLTINIHAYFINIAGLFDNLGWAFVYENRLFGKPKENKINRNGVGLFNKKTQERLKPDLLNYLTGDKIKLWYENYSKGYRDALAHRIPLYVPPAILNKSEADTYRDIDRQICELNLSKKEDISTWGKLMDSQNALGSISWFFAHSAAENEPALLHPQLISDYLTVEEVVEKFCIHF